MSPETFFSLASAFAALGWLVLAAGAIAKRDFLYGTLAGRVWPYGLAAAYGLLILFFWGRAQGGFDSLAHVQQLFSSPWLLMAGWVHYLAFDLFVGAWITGQVIARGLPRLALVALLPLTFLFGPIGLLGYFFTQLAFERREVMA
ncbi:MAG: DUF4281 domain-containing protein [Alphaproteobacteria bacterium]|nr:DUF4281 domain-containing protein [Alphaproteobacteria bacterium]